MRFFEGDEKVSFLASEFVNGGVPNRCPGTREQPQRAGHKPVTEDIRGIAAPHIVCVLDGTSQQPSDQAAY